MDANVRKCKKFGTINTKQQSKSTEREEKSEASWKKSWKWQRPIWKIARALTAKR